MSKTITRYQCKMARAALGWRAEDVAQFGHLSLSTVTRFELGTTEGTRTTRERLRALFEQNGVTFLGEFGVSYVPPSESLENQ